MSKSYPQINSKGVKNCVGSQKMRGEGGERQRMPKHMIYV